MYRSATRFLNPGPQSRHSAELLIAWMDAADDASDAYAAWRDADSSEQANAFVVYRAALDREEAAARALEFEAAPSVSP